MKVGRMPPPGGCPFFHSFCSLTVLSSLMMPSWTWSPASSSHEGEGRSSSTDRSAQLPGVCSQCGEEQLESLYQLLSEDMYPLNALQIYKYFKSCEYLTFKFIFLPWKCFGIQEKKIIDMDSKVSIISGSNTNEKLEHLCFFVCLFLLIWATIDRGWKGEAECTLEGLYLSSLSTSHKQKWQEHFCAYSGGVSWTTSRHSWQHTQSLGSAFVVWNGKYSGRECYLLKSQID